VSSHPGFFKAARHLRAFFDPSLLILFCHWEVDLSGGNFFFFPSQVLTFQVAACRCAFLYLVSALAARMLFVRLVFSSVLQGKDVPRLSPRAEPAAALRLGRMARRNVRGFLLATSSVSGVLDPKTKIF